MQDYQLSLTSEASLRTTPQDALTNCESDYTSIFGTFGNDFLKGISIMHSEENLNTPFARETMMNNVFTDDANIPASEANDSYYDEDDFDASSSTLGYEC